LSLPPGGRISLVVGFDQREAVAYHTFCQSVLEKSSLPVQFTPLAENTLAGYKETHTDGSNRFIYSRFLTPYLSDYSGWALFADGDMVCQADIAELWALRDPAKAVQVVQHDYQTKANVKYLGNRNENYPRKNWSSVILWNCAHEAHRVLTPEFIQRMPGSYLHRFSWLDDSLVGELPRMELARHRVSREPAGKAHPLHARHPLLRGVPGAGNVPDLACGLEPPAPGLRRRRPALTEGTTGGGAPSLAYHRQPLPQETSTAHVHRNTHRHVAGPHRCRAVA
jgi:hypothetical protein